MVRQSSAPEQTMTDGRIAHWRVLVVDDEPGVHEITRLVLARHRYLDIPVLIDCVGSAAEARHYLNAHPDTALILLDVVMESDHAGLDLVRHIRHRLNNKAVQILLRTGQPGVAPETDVIVDYEINGYYLKTELTAQRLTSIVTFALRSYHTIHHLPTVETVPDASLVTPRLVGIQGQPQIQLSSGRVIGFGLIPRWRLKDGELDLPGADALPLNAAQRAGMDAEVLAEAGAWAARQAAICPPRMRFSVPLLTPLSDGQTLLELVQSSLSGHLPLDLCLSDRGGTTGQPALPACDALREFGMTITLREVGSTAVSLARVRSIGPDRIALPVQFVDGVADNGDKTAIARAIIALTHTLGLNAIATGIDHEADARFFKWEGCDIGQGDYFGEPSSLDEIARQLRQSPAH